MNNNILIKVIADLEKKASYNLKEIEKQLKIEQEKEQLRKQLENF